MTKIKLTQEQAAAIEKWLSEGEGNVDKLMNSHARNSYDTDSKRYEVWGGCYDSLNSLSVVDMAKALYVGYEVEPQFKVGDYIVKTRGEKFVNHLNVVEVEKVMENYITFGGGIAVLKSKIRHATQEEIKAEKERQLWMSIGREVGEFRIGDIRMRKGNVVIKVMDLDRAKIEYYKGDLKGFFPVEQFISFESEESK